MSDSNIRVWTVDGDSYGEALEYPPFAKYRMEPHYPGASGDSNHDIVLYTVDENRDEQELGRHAMGEVLLAFAGQPSPFKSEGNVSAPKAATKKTEKSGAATTK